MVILSFFNHQARLIIINREMKKICTLSKSFYLSSLIVVEEWMFQTLSGCDPVPEVQSQHFLD